MRFIDRYFSEILAGCIVLCVFGIVYLVIISGEHGEQRRDLSIQECIVFCDKRGVYSWESESTEVHTMYVGGKQATYTTISTLCECKQEAP